MENKYVGRWGFFEEDQFLVDLIETIKEGKDFDKLEKLLTDAFIKDCVCQEDLYKMLLKLIRLASGENKIEEFGSHLETEEQKG